MAPRGPVADLLVSRTRLPPGVTLARAAGLLSGSPALPGALPELEAPRGERPVPVRSGPILIVDDDVDMVAMAAAVLKPLCIPILEASNGARALALALEEHPSLIVLDAMMPGMHGFDVCRALKNQPETKDIPIILCSAVHSGWQMYEDAKSSLGVEMFLPKPFKLAALSQAARELLFGKGSPGAEEGVGVSDARKGRQLLQQGDAAGAVWHLTAATQARPSWPEAHFYLALALDRNGQQYQAVNALERAVKLKPDFFVGLKHLAALYERMGVPSSARSAWEQALETCPTPEERAWIQQRLEQLTPVEPG